MADKLTETSWTGFVKKLKVEVDDKALVKALVAWDKTDEAKPEPRLKAVEEVVRQIQEQVKAIVKRKKELGDKPFGELKDKLYGLLEVAESIEKTTQKTVDAAASAASDDDDEESPALLTTKMIPLIRAVRKGDVVLQSLVALAGRETVVMLSRKAISPSRGKLLKEQMTNPSGLKFIRGECIFEANALTFVVQGSAAGLAKKIKAALQAQTELRLKVRVRGEDPDDVEEEGEEEADAASTAAAPAAGVAPSAPAAAATEPADDRGDASARFNARLTALLPKIKAATNAEVKAIAAKSGVSAREHDFIAAERGLDQIERLLDPERRDKALAAWQVERTVAIASLKSVAGKIAAARHASSAKAIMEIQAVMKNLTAAPSTLQQVTELRNYIGSDDIVHDVSELAEDIRTPLLGALDTLRAALVD